MREKEAERTEKERKRERLFNNQRAILSSAVLQMISTPRLSSCVRSSGSSSLTDKLRLAPLRLSSVPLELQEQQSNRDRSRISCSKTEAVLSVPCGSVMRPQSDSKTQRSQWAVRRPHSVPDHTVNGVCLLHPRLQRALDECCRNKIKLQY